MKMSIHALERQLAQNPPDDKDFDTEDETPDEAYEEILDEAAKGSKARIVRKNKNK